MAFQRQKNNMGERIYFRLSTEEKNEIKVLAEQCLIPVSTYLRRSALQRRIVSKTDYLMLNELRRQGGNLRNLLTKLEGGKDKELALSMVATIREIVAVVDKAMDFEDEDREG